MVSTTPTLDSTPLLAVDRNFPERRKKHKRKPLKTVDSIPNITMLLSTEQVMLSAWSNKQVFEHEE